MILHCYATAQVECALNNRDNLETFLPTRGRGDLMRLVQPPDVAKTFDRYPAGLRKKLLALRTLIIEVAAQTARETA